MIVGVAVIAGATLPLLMHFVLHTDPVNAGSTIQVSALCFPICALHNAQRSARC
jgi:hypothetical protein